MIVVDPKKCPQDHRCPILPRCRVGAISQKETGLPTVDPEKCIDCGVCITGCPLGAFEKTTRKG